VPKTLAKPNARLGLLVVLELSLVEPIDGDEAKVVRAQQLVSKTFQISCRFTFDLVKQNDVLIFVGDYDAHWAVCFVCYRIVSLLGVVVVKVFIVIFFN